MGPSGDATNPEMDDPMSKIEGIQIFSQPPTKKKEE